MTGPIFDPTSLGGLTAWRVCGVATVLVALMSVILVIRHTRAEEESGRAELVGSAVVGRHALPAAAVILVAAADLAAGLAVTAALAGLGLQGAFAFGMSIAGTGWLFAGLAVLAAQLTQHAHTASAIGHASVGVAFVLRAAGDASGLEWLSWTSPLGWAQRVRPFAGEQWWVLGLLAAVALGLVGAAVLLARRRDLGAGLLPARRGPAAAARHLAPAWRMHRATLLGWTIAFAAVGTLFGLLAQSITALVTDNPQIAELLARLGGDEGTLVDTFFATELGLLGLVAGGYAVNATLRLRAEEQAGRAEPVLATAVPRWRWAAGHLALALAGTTLILAAGGLGAGLAHGLRVGDVSGQLPRLLAAALAQAPAAWVLAGLAMLLFGALPRLTGLAWAALLACVLLGELGQLLQIDEAIRRVSPYEHLPALPGAGAGAAPFLWLGAVAAALVAAGLLAFRRRDLTGP
ncbi:ABC transporter permease [Nonomuraea africana]|uniref:ABC transporter permease n=1 Tax=Nonomuraea africana TaxID=46171 RepID=UPI0033EF1CE7